MSIVDEIMASKRKVGGLVVEEALDMIEKAFTFLNKNESMILKMRMDGRTLGECSRKIGRTPNRISQIAKEARDVLRLYLETDGKYPYFHIVCHSIVTQRGYRKTDFEQILAETKTINRKEALDFYKGHNRKNVYVKIHKVYQQHKKPLRFFF